MIKDKKVVNFIGIANMDIPHTIKKTSTLNSCHRCNISHIIILTKCFGLHNSWCIMEQLQVSSRHVPKFFLAFHHINLASFIMIHVAIFIKVLYKDKRSLLAGCYKFLITWLLHFQISLSFF